MSLRCKNLVLDAGPLLSLSPLRGLAEVYFTVPQVLAELKDKRAREHFERLGLTSGVKVEVVSPDAASLSTVIRWAKKTGDYAVLSHPDLCVLALTYSIHEREKSENLNVNEPAPKTSNTAPIEEPVVESEYSDTDAAEKESGEPAPKTSNTAPIEEPVVESEYSDTDAAEKESGEPAPKTSDTATPIEEPVESEYSDTDTAEKESSSDSEDKTPEANQMPSEDVADEEENLEPLDVELQPLDEEPRPPPTDSMTPPSPPSSPEPVYDDPSDEDDGEGEWITPGNVGLHKSRALDLLPSAGERSKGKQKAAEDETFAVGCMTADFAMQNVLLQMGLNLVGAEGKRIQKLKSWVLRCHACFKICKDNTKKFCPSCGNATLLRASVTISSPGAASDAPVMQVHLKPNFQYRLRGTKYSIPAPKAGSAKTGSGEGLILREDQTEYVRAKKMADGRRQREEAKMQKGILGREGGVGSWLDPDWMPEMLSVGAGGKGRTIRPSGRDGDMPAIGYGRRNPNERKRRK